jgi:hypothetical protein
LDIDNDRRTNLIDWRHPAIFSMAASFDFASLPPFANPHVLTESEWHAYQADISCEIWHKQSWRGGIILLLLRLLGWGWVAVLVAEHSKGFQEIYDAGSKAGNCTAEE